MTHAYIKQLLLDENINVSQYPYNIPAVKQLEAMDFSHPITFLIGENGSGKSTILEALALAAGFNAEGGTKNFSFKTADTTSDLHKHIRLSRGPVREKEGFFLRAESFYNVATEAANLGLAYGGKSFHNQSHGESFLSLANHRFASEGLYILDEPEAALSPQRQLAFLTRIHDLVKEKSQFIIASHSPILLAYPAAQIYELDDNGVQPVTYEQTEHFALTLDFLSNHKTYIKKLFKT